MAVFLRKLQKTPREYGEFLQKIVWKFVQFSIFFKDCLPYLPGFYNNQ
jgi:hypothetical protein